MLTRSMKRAGGDGSGGPPRKNTKPDPPADDEEETCCPICLDPPSLMKKKLRCGHEFCFLCIKGVFNKNNRLCPICRAEIGGLEFDRPFDDFDLKVRVGGTQNANGASGQGPSSSNTAGSSRRRRSSRRAEVIYWLYAGRSSGWWRYTPEVETAIEQAFNRDDRDFQVLLAGSLYKIDFVAMEQTSIEDNAKRVIMRVDEGEFDDLVEEGNIRGVGGVESSR